MASLPQPLNEIDIEGAIDAAVEANREAPRGHLGASLLGHPCDRWLWLTFRWAVIERFNGRMLRLFRRGKREEETIVEDLKAAGLVIHNTGADQMSVSFGCNVSGSLDGIIESGVPGAEKTRHVAEFKTSSLKAFKELQAKGVCEAKRQHWCQMQVYMLGTGIDRALYISVCKDNDQMYAERVYFDRAAAQALVERGKTITMAERIPAPLSTDPTWWQCKYCPAYEFCFQSRCTQEINCRTCCHSTPTRDGTFVCSRPGLTPYVVSESEQLLACHAHVLHPDLVPWRWLGGTDDQQCAIYEKDGEKVVNGWSGFGGVESWRLLGGKDPEEGLKEEKVPF